MLGYWIVVVVSFGVLFVVFDIMLLDVVIFDFWLIGGEMGFDVIMVL